MVKLYGFCVLHILRVGAILHRGSTDSLIMVIILSYEPSISLLVQTQCARLYTDSRVTCSEIWLLMNCMQLQGFSIEIRVR